MTKSTTKAVRYHAVKCPGEAHSNPNIDNCGLCAPLWGEIIVPIECLSVHEWYRMEAGMSKPDRDAHKRARKAFAKKLAR